MFFPNEYYGYLRTSWIDFDVTRTIQIGYVMINEELSVPLARTYQSSRTNMRNGVNLERVV